jgi:hypothetical protein
MNYSGRTPVVKRRMSVYSVWYYKGNHFYATAAGAGKTYTETHFLISATTMTHLPRQAVTGKTS